MIMANGKPFAVVPCCVHSNQFPKRMLNSSEGGGIPVRSYNQFIAYLMAKNPEIKQFELPFRGRNIYVTGDRPAPEPWTVTFFNDTDFMVRTAMERWHNGINNFADNTGVTNAADYQTDLFVEQLDRDDTILKTYIFRSAFPISVGQIDLTNEETTTIETFEVQWRYQHFEPSSVL